MEALTTRDSVTVATVLPSVVGKDDDGLHVFRLKIIDARSSLQLCVK